VSLSRVTSINFSNAIELMGGWQYHLWLRTVVSDRLLQGNSAAEPLFIKADLQELGMQLSGRTHA
jgi:hypothetical protein